MDEIRFGVEIETCMHILDNSLFQEDFSDPDKILREIEKCGKLKLPEFKWEVITDEATRSLNYNSWIIMPDSSITCSENKYCVVKGEYSSCPELYFYSVEFVTPILKGKEGLKKLSFFWLAFLFGDNFLYAVNESQGIHVNISHKDMNVENFVNLWAYYEPVIIQLLPEERRINIMDMAIPIYILKKMRSDEKLVILVSDKYSSISVKNDIKNPDNSRIEIRVKEGDMLYDNIMPWIIFCMRLLELSLKKEYEAESKYETKEEKMKLLSSFFSEIKDTNLVEYLNFLYFTNKEENWPIFTFSGKTEEIYENITENTFSPEIQEKIQMIRKMKCE